MNHLFTKLVFLDVKEGWCLGCCFLVNWGQSFEICFQGILFPGTARMSIMWHAGPKYWDVEEHASFFHLGVYVAYIFLKF